VKPHRTKKQELQEKLVFEQCIRIGICTCLMDLIQENAKLIGGDQEKAVADIESGLRKTAASLKIEAKDVKGDIQNISFIINKGVEQMLDQVFRDVRKRLPIKSVH
jgi:hypothetical protein